MNYYYVSSDRTRTLDIKNESIMEQFPHDTFSVTVSNETLALNLPETIASVEQIVMNDCF